MCYNLHAVTAVWPCYCQYCLYTVNIYGKSEIIWKHVTFHCC